MVVKVNFSPWWQEGVRQLAVQPIETRVERRPPAVRVVEGVETWKQETEVEHLRGPKQNLAKCRKSSSSCRRVLS